MSQALKDFHAQILALVALIVLVVGFVVCPQERLDHIGHALVTFGTFPAGQAIYAALAALALAGIRWALSYIPARFRSETTVTVQQVGPVKVEPTNKESGHALPASLFLVIAVGATVALIATHLQGCGGPPVTAAQRTAYSVEAAHCLEAEQAIADRPATTEAQDMADLAAEEARCDAARQAIEHPVDGGL